MAKEPRPGQVKTRLIPAIGAAAAAGLYRAFLQDVLDEMALVPRAERVLAIHPAAARPWFAELGGERWSIALQRGETLPDRMIGVFDELFRGGATAVVMRNSDSPTLPAARVTAALALLERGADLVLGPDHGGGYCLVGLRAPRPDLFRGVAMSTASVLEETLRRARLFKLRVELQPEWLDVDTPDDLAELRRELKPGSTLERASCDRTTAFLAGIATLRDLGRQTFPSPAAARADEAGEPPAPRAVS